MVYHAAQAVKLISEAIGLPTIDQENEQLYTEEPRRTFRVPVTITREGFATVKARDAKTAENVAKVMAALADDIENAVQNEFVGTAVEA